MIEKLIEGIVKLGILGILVLIFGGIIKAAFGFIFSFLFKFIFGFALFPVMVVLFISMIVKLSNKKKKTKKADNKIKKLKSRIKNFMSEEQLEQVDASLAQFFQNSASLKLSEEAYLAPKNGSYTKIDDLVLWYENEAISTLGDLSSEHAAKCGEILAFLRGESDEMTQDGLKVGKTVLTGDGKEKKKNKTRAHEFAEEIVKLDVAIEDEEISKGLEETVARLSGIHYTELNFPDSEKLRKLYDYYLPLLTGMLTKFARLEKKAPLSRDFMDTKDKLSETIDMINEAMLNIASDFYGGQMVDITADAKTLQSILKKDGMVGGIKIPEEVSDKAFEDSKLSEVKQDLKEIEKELDEMEETDSAELGQEGRL